MTDEPAAMVWMIHGAMQDRRQFLPLLAQLPERLPLLLSDLAGHGQRRDHWQHLAGLDPSALAADLLARHPAITSGGPLWLVGHSLGALVALALAARLGGPGNGPEGGAGNGPEGGAGNGPEGGTGNGPEGGPGSGSKRGAERGGVVGLILGDPPLLPRDIPAPLQAGALASADPLERRLVAESFFRFEHNGPYLQQLAALVERLPVRVLLGLQGPFRRADGFSDCGTLVGQASRERLLALAAQRPRLGLHGIADAGHFVFHAPSGQALVARVLAETPIPGQERG